MDAVSIGGDSKMSAAVNSEGKINNGIFYCYYLAAIFYYLTTHNNIPADKCPGPSNRGMNRGRRSSMPSNNNSMCRDERLGVGACDRRTLSPTNNMRSRKNGGGGYIGFGDENNNSSPIKSPNPKKKKGLFYFVVHIVCILFIVCILMLQL